MLKSAVILTVVLACFVISAEADCNGYTDEYDGDFCKFDLYLRGSQSMRQSLQAVCEDIRTSAIIDADQTLILINGHTSAVNFVSRIKYEIDLIESVNIIAVDWRDDDNKYDSDNVEEAGKCVSGFINSMIKSGKSNVLKIHIVGFSLGAHVAGLGGRGVKEGTVARITGLDPARNSDSKLTRTSATYVEVIHTDGGLFGYGINSQIGDSDFYANNGRSQPGCSNHICCHNRAHELFAASISNQLVGHECDSNAQIDLNLCKGHREIMGNINLDKKYQPQTPTESSTSDSRQARFRVNTKRSYPFY